MYIAAVGEVSCTVVPVVGSQLVNGVGLELAMKFPKENFTVL
jgi:hypothetical protein